MRHRGRCAAQRSSGPGGAAGPAESSRAVVAAGGDQPAMHVERSATGAAPGSLQPVPWDVWAARARPSIESASWEIGPGGPVGSLDTPEGAVPCAGRARGDVAKVTRRTAVDSSGGDRNVVGASFPP